jgi:hypothetical protein
MDFPTISANLSPNAFLFDASLTTAEPRCAVKFAQYQITCENVKGGLEDSASYVNLGIPRHSLVADRFEANNSSWH